MLSSLTFAFTVSCGADVNLNSPNKGPPVEHSGSLADFPAEGALQNSGNPLPPGLTEEEAEDLRSELSKVTELFLVHHFVTFCSLSFIASHCFVILCTHFFAVLTVLYKPINFSDINLIYVIKILLGLLPPSLCTLPQNNTFLVSHPVELCVEDYLFLHV